MHKTRVIKHSALPLILLLMISIMTPGAIAEEAISAAFPGAQGFGKYSQGGRGGAIVAVSNLEDHGPGSLRACAEAQGPRNCIFEVGGTIVLKTPIMVTKQNAFLSILGQTAPGGGILLTIKEENKVNKHTPLIIKGSHDVIIRHIRLRPVLPTSVKNIDALTVEDSARIYVDHVSGSWATDENVNTHANSTDVTIAYSIFGEGQNKHSKCALLGSNPTRAQNITFWKNACISNRDRNPDDNHFGGSCIEIVNNIFYNAISEWGEVFSQYPGGTPISYVGNYFKAGPSTEDLTYAINWNPTLSADNPHIYQKGNEIWTYGNKKVVLIAPDTFQHLVDEPPCPLAIEKILSANDAYSDVRHNSGAMPRDEIDTRFIAEIGKRGTKGKGATVKAPGILPDIKNGTPYADLDGDGMDDATESQVGADPKLSDPWVDSDGDGWSNFDQFMEKRSTDLLAANAAL